MGKGKKDDKYKMVRVLLPVEYYDKLEKTSHDSAIKISPLVRKVLETWLDDGTVKYIITFNQPKETDNER